MFSRIVRAAVAAILLAAAPAGAATKPTFDCAKAKHDIERLICADDELAALDQRMAEVFASAIISLKGLSDEKTAEQGLRTYQRGWVGGRNECWKAEDKRQCAIDSYSYRIAQIEAQYFLAKAGAPVFFTYNDNPANEIVATFLETDPPSGRFERGDKVYVAILKPSCSGEKYGGEFGFEFWTKGNEAMVVMPDPNREELKCSVRK